MVGHVCEMADSSDAESAVKLKDVSAKLTYLLKANNTSNTVYECV